jgi:uroporphyrinogen-III decarboxylase
VQVRARSNLDQVQAHGQSQFSMFCNYRDKDCRCAYQPSRIVRRDRAVRPSDICLPNWT